MHLNLFCSQPKTKTRINELTLRRIIFWSSLVVWDSWYWIRLTQNRNELQALVSKVMNHFLLWVVGELSFFQERLYFFDLIILGERSSKLTSNVNRTGSIIVVTTGNKVPAFYKFQVLYRIHKNMSLSLVFDVTRKRSVSFWWVETSKKNDKHFDPCRLDY